MIVVVDLLESKTVDMICLIIIYHVTLIERSALLLENCCLVRLLCPCCACKIEMKCKGKAELGTQLFVPINGVFSMLGCGRSSNCSRKWLAIRSTVTASSTTSR